MAKEPTDAVFSGALTKRDMKAFTKEAERRGVSRISLLRYWIKQADARAKR